MTTMLRAASLLSVAVLSSAACRSHDDHRALPTAGDVAARPAADVLVSTASAADLARELDDADQHGTWKDVKQRWVGRHVKWTVTRARVLCGRADACHVSALPIVKDHPARHGWLPGLSFAPGAFDALASACGASDPCELTIVGTVSELVANPDLPQSVKLSDVVVAGDKLASAR